MFWRTKPITGIIYDASWGKTSGEVIIVIDQQGRTFTAVWQGAGQSEIVVSAVRGVGAGLLIISALGIALSTYPLVSTELNYRINQVGQAKQQQEQAARLAALAQKEAEERAYATQLAQEFGITDTNFSVYIPKINARSSIIANVDPGNPDTYINALRQGVAHAYGSAVPGESKGSYLFAHSTNGPWNVSQYNAVFYLLRELDPTDTDEIYVFYQGRAHKYKVAEKHITDANDVSWLTNSSQGPERLILQTCWPPGTIWKRLIVVAYPDTTAQANSLPSGQTGQAEQVYGGI